MPSNAARPVVVQAPATVGNFGPGFDAFSLALHGLGDRVELRAAARDRIVVEGPGADAIPTAWRRNVAGVALDALRRRTGIRRRFEVRLRKRMRGGSGLGSSASSAGGAALAFHAAHPDARLAPEDLVAAAGEGEAAAAGRHYDDVAAVVLGGLAIVRSAGKTLRLARVAPPRGLHIAVLVPDLALATRDMRRLLPRRVRREDAVHNLGNAAALVDAFHRGDVPAIGGALDDRIATPPRKRRVPFFDDARAAAMRAGAHGAALSGSGPAMVAVCASRRDAGAAADAMARATRRHGIAAQGLAARPEREVMHRAVGLH